MTKINTIYNKSTFLSNTLKQLITFVLMLLFFSCTRNNNIPGYEFAGDMSKSVAYETYSESSLFDENKSALEPVKGTIPREMVPYEYENTNEGLKKAGIEFKNPLKVSDENIKRGKYVFDIFCLNCHGENGDGNGFLFTSEKYAIQPTSLINEKTKSRPDGEIYHVISVGGAAMGSYASQIKPTDRWKIIQFIRYGLDDNME